jgi:hypothetical protein
MFQGLVNSVSIVVRNPALGYQCLGSDVDAHHIHRVVNALNNRYKDLKNLVNDY